MTDSPRPKSQRALASIIFLSRWLQAPLYLGLILAQAAYVYHFMVELWHLLSTVRSIDEKQIMLVVLGLIDVVMIANLLIMVIVGGYETFVSRLDLDGHRDQPEWLSHVNAGMLKVKLATALIGISSIHLLKTFIELGSTPTPEKAAAAAEVAKIAAESGRPVMSPENAVMWQVVVHITFVLSALLLAWIDRVSTKTALESRAQAH